MNIQATIQDGSGKVHQLNDDEILALRSALAHLYWDNEWGGKGSRKKRSVVRRLMTILPPESACTDDEKQGPLTEKQVETHWKKSHSLLKELTEQVRSGDPDAPRKLIKALAEADRNVC